MSFPDRRTGANEQVLVSGENPDWAVVVEKLGRRSYRTSLYVEQQGFTLARCEDEMEAEVHCLNIGRMFVTALTKLLRAQNTSAIRRAAEVAQELEPLHAKTLPHHRPAAIAVRILALLEPRERVNVRKSTSAKTTKRHVRKVP